MTDLSQEANASASLRVILRDMIAGFVLEPTVNLLVGRGALASVDHLSVCSLRIA